MTLLISSINKINNMKNIVLVLILLLVGGTALFSDTSVQTFSDLTSATSNIDMTAHAEILVFSQNNNLLIYSNNGSQFLHKSEFSGKKDIEGLSITTDGEWILHVDGSAFYIHRYNHTSNDYSLFQEL